MTDVTALVLAAGAGRRYGGPKALARDADGIPWLTQVTTTLASAGHTTVAVLPHGHPEAADLLASGAGPLFVDTFSEGIGASLRAGLTALLATEARATLVALVDQPTLPETVLARILSPLSELAARHTNESRPVSDGIIRNSGGLAPRLLDPGRDGMGEDTVLRRAAFEGQPGHPVLIGRAHWGALIGTLHGDQGAGRYFREHLGELVECADLWNGADIDERPGAAGA